MTNDEKERMWQVIYSVSRRTPEGGLAGKGDKPPPLHILRSRGAHTQLSLATFKGGLMMEKCNGNHYWVGYL